MRSYKKMLFGVLFLFALASAFAADEQAIIQLSISYDVNLSKVEISELKVMPGYLSAEEKPGNATIYLLSGDGSKLYEIRAAFIEPIFVTSPPRIDPDSNTVIGDYNSIYPSEGLKQISLPYYKEAASVKILFDNKKEFAFSIAERLCNNNNACDPEESALSCGDCRPDKEDGVCIAAYDNVCDPDCFRGVDPDCIPALQPTPTPTQQETPTVTATPKQVEQWPLFYIYLVLFVILIALFAMLYYKKIKGD